MLNGGLAGLRAFAAQTLVRPSPKRRACGFARICSPDTRAAFASSPSLTGAGSDQGTSHPVVMCQFRRPPPNGMGSRPATCGA
jgi:hypothetical protein